MKFPHSTSYFPAFPQVEVSLARVNHSPSVGPLSALLDTGADGTLIPTMLLERVNARVGDEMLLHPLFGPPRVVHIYGLDLLVGELRLPAIEVVGDDTGTEIILGRDVLRKLVVLLDGPQSLTEILERRL